LQKPLLVRAPRSDPRPAPSLPVVRRALRGVEVKLDLGAVRIEEEDLPGTNLAGRTDDAIGNADSVEPVQRSAQAFRTKGHMVEDAPAWRRHVLDADDVKDRLRSDVEPAARHRKRWPRALLHPEHFGIEAARGVETIGDDRE